MVDLFCVTVVAPHETWVADEDVFCVIVVAPYETIVKEDDITVTPHLGKSKILRCHIEKDGDPVSVSSKHWYHNSQELTITPSGTHQYIPGSQGLQLQLIKLTKAESGEYTCWINNGQYPRMMKSFILNVICKWYIC